MFKEYIGRERERAIQKTYRTKNEKEPIQYKEEGNTVETKTEESNPRERGHGLRVTPIGIDFHGKGLRRISQEIWLSPKRV